VNPGETLIGLALRYRVSVESISSLNGFDVEAPLQLEQTLEIPWPTATPPLVAVVVTVRGVNIVADPSSCDWYEVQAGDSISSIAAKNDVDFQLLMLLNRMSEETILFQGDALCIPEITIGGFLPATPGPTPTPTAVPPPAGPTLLYPIRDAVITGEDQIVTLQWVAVKDLDQTEWYMVEVADLDEIDSLPRRAFTRDNSFQIPASWRPEGPETHLIRWRVGVVTVTGKRSDGQNIYGYGGEFSEESLFYWSGSSEATVPPISAPSDTSP
jgi:LysM repeat protein